MKIMKLWQVWLGVIAVCSTLTVEGQAWGFERASFAPRVQAARLKTVQFGDGVANAKRSVHFSAKKPSANPNAVQIATRSAKLHIPAGMSAGVLGEIKKQFAGMGVTLTPVNRKRLFHKRGIGVLASEVTLHLSGEKAAVKKAQLLLAQAQGLLSKPARDPSTAKARQGAAQEPAGARVSEQLAKGVTALGVKGLKKIRAGIGVFDAKAAKLLARIMGAGKEYHISVEPQIRGLIGFPVPIQVPIDR